MTSSKTGPPSTTPTAAGGGTVGTAIRSQERALIDAVLVHLVDEIDAYRAMPPEAIDSDIVEAVERGIHLFLDTLGRAELPDRAAMDELSESAARRAEERIPLESVIAAYLISARVVVEQITQPSDIPEVRDIGAAVSLSLRFLRAATDVVVARYQEERQVLDDLRTSTEQATLGELLAGTYRRDEHPDDDLAEAHDVLRLHIAPNDDELGGGLGASVAGHRKLRRLRAAIDSSGIDGILSGLHPAGGFVLVPASPLPDGGATPEPARAAERIETLVRSLAEASQADVHVARTTADSLDEIAEAAHLGDDIVELVLQIGRPPGTYQLADVTLAFQLSRPGPARRLLAASLDPLRHRPDLVSTLRVFLDRGLNRRRAALDLGVHPNTVDYRLRRVATLTGLDATEPTDAFTLAAALQAHDTEPHPAPASS